MPAIASAGPRTARENEARKACLKGEYEKGVDILVDLFVETKDPTYIFNQGRCYEQNQQFKVAISRFEEYMRAKADRLLPADKASAEKHISDCRASLAQERESLVQPPPVAVNPVQPSPEPKPTVAEAPVIEAQPVTAPAHRRWGLIGAGIATGTVGLGGIVAGVLLHLKANNMVSDMQAQPGSWTSNKESTQKSYKTWSMVGYGVGAAGVLVGAILVGVGSKSSHESSSDVALVPSFGVGHAGASLKGSF